MSAPEPIRWHGESSTLELLDQRRLPGACVYEAKRTVEEVHEAIRELRVRGAPAIGIAAAYGLVLAAAAAPPGREDLLAAVDAAARRLRSARPTAVNLAWALERLLAVARCAAGDGGDVARALEAEAEALHAEDRTMCRAIGAAGRHLITPGSRVLTHCNAGALAVSELGTATAPLYLAAADGVPFTVYVGETRPLLQGARLTAWELGEAGIDVVLMCDNTAAEVMSRGLIDLVLVGTDRVTANGDVVNKIGTLGLAVLCRHFGVPFYVACPASTFDPATACGADVVIEQREGAEVRAFAGAEVAPAGAVVHNPAFDVTPHGLVSAFVTPAGVLEPPFRDTLRALLRPFAAQKPV